MCLYQYITNMAESHEEKPKCFSELFADATFIFLAYLALLFANGKPPPPFHKLGIAIAGYIGLVMLFQKIHNASVARTITTAMGIALGSQIMGIIS
jgi:hypothetical protein